MKVEFSDFKSIVLLIDSQKNIVIFPFSKSNFPIKLADGSFEEYGYFPAYYPIELSPPYDASTLALTIKYGIEQCDKHPCYSKDGDCSLSIEEKYYGIKGFKKATKGKINIRLGWDDKQGNFLYLFAPTKSGQTYFMLDKTILPYNAEWIDFANAVIEYINLDITQIDRYKIYSRDLNL